MSLFDKKWDDLSVKENIVASTVITVAPFVVLVVGAVAFDRSLVLANHIKRKYNDIKKLK